MRRCLVLCLLITGTLACSGRGAYDSIQMSNRLACAELPPSQYEECLSNASIPYHEYDHDRKANANER
ncbi:MAG: hypothetical protein R3183_01260 [Oleiphilaceae bacterium]|nr:hypothetical protein [Oleiphilaceae bacterium]